MKIGTYLDNVRATTPLVHNITNYVTVHDVANILLACGGSPIMSDEPDDVADITSICGGLNINIGTLNKRSIEAMFVAGRRRCRNDRHDQQGSQHQRDPSFHTHYCHLLFLFQNSFL